MGIIIAIFILTYFQTGAEFLGQEVEFLEKPPLNLTYDAYSQYCHDATWTFAYALNETLSGNFVNLERNFITVGFVLQT